MKIIIKPRKRLDFKIYKKIINDITVAFNRLYGINEDLENKIKALDLAIKKLEQMGIRVSDTVLKPIPQKEPIPQKKESRYKSRICVDCGKEFIPWDPRGNRCPDCRIKPKERKLKNFKPIPCDTCGTEFTPNNPRWKTCPSCRVLSEEDKKVVKEIIKEEAIPAKPKEPKTQIEKYKARKAKAKINQPGVPDYNQRPHHHNNFGRL